MNRLWRAARGAAYVLLAAGLFAMAYVAYVVIDAYAFQARERSRFERERAVGVEVRTDPGAETLPSPPAETAITPFDGVRARAAAPTGQGVIGDIQIARIGLSAMVIEGDSRATLRRGVGHLADTALPGEAGNVVLAGHRDTFFRPLDRVRIGDVITLRTQGGDFQYQVDSTSVVPLSRVEVLQPTAERTLTLITCYPFAFVGPAPDRFIVRARETAASR